ncbi:MAG: hypothetical protein EP338_00520 [Bacteroidetes bacterium]|nr:MAG: hypothetical protein EP338_00520 [Bacteroidota bacterium]
MKKIVFAIIGLGMITSVSAQEAFDKKFQIGLVTGFGLNFNKPLSNLVERNGVGSDLTFGININYNVNSTFAVNTGLEFDFDRFKYKTKSGDSLYYYYNDTEIFQKEEYMSEKNKSFFQLSERSQKANYLTIPVNAMLKTKPFGNLQYFGKFGTRLSFRTAVSRANDEGHIADSITLVRGASTSNTNMKVAGDINFFKASVGLSGGAQWNFSGSTTLIAELGFYYGLTPIHSREAITGSDRQRNFTLVRVENGIREFKGIEAKQSQLMLKLSLFF